MTIIDETTTERPSANAMDRPPITAGTVLTDEMLARFDERAAEYDRENRFFFEDFEELRQSGYLRLALPAEYGGLGLTLSQAGALQQRLAYHAPATAIAVNMHLYWTGMAAEMRRFGDHSCDWILAEAADGHVFAAGHGEHGESSLFFSGTTAERVDGGWVFTGHKIFGSLSPVWTYFGIHAMDTSDPSRPQVVHAFVPRDATGYRIEPTWDTLGMRATASHDTILENVFVADRHVGLVCPAGAAGAGLFHLGILAWGLLGFAQVYTGIAHRAYDLTIERLHQRRSLALTRSMAHHPEIQHGVAQMRMALEAADAYLGRICDDWSNGVDHGTDWALKIASAKYFAVNQAWSVVDTALELSGGGGIFKKNRLEQLFRDARLGRFHPTNSMATHEVVAKTALGIDLDEQPRWG